MNPRLGRILFHDERSRAFPAPGAAEIHSVTHKRHVRPYDQGSTSSCTGMAMAGAVCTDGLWNGKRRLYESSALGLYKVATTLDTFPGSYPEVDEGSTSLAVAKAAQAKGYVTSYSHAFGLDHTLAALSLSPVMVGTNWYEDMFNPVNSFISIGGDIVGGHEYLLTGLNVEQGYVTACNSWGMWGDKGYFKMTFATLGRLLAEQGDALVAVK